MSNMIEPCGLCNSMGKQGGCPRCGLHHYTPGKAKTYDAGAGSRNRKLPPPTDVNHLLELIAALTARINELEQRMATIERDNERRESYEAEQREQAE